MSGLYQAYKQVKRNKGAVGIDRQSLSAFESNRYAENEIFTWWTRMRLGGTSSSSTPFYLGSGIRFITVYVISCAVF